MSSRKLTGWSDVTDDKVEPEEAALGPICRDAFGVSRTPLKGPGLASLRPPPSSAVSVPVDCEPGRGREGVVPILCPAESAQHRLIQKRVKE